MVPIPDRCTRPLSDETLSFLKKRRLFINVTARGLTEDIFLPLEGEKKERLQHHAPKLPLTQDGRGERKAKEMRLPLGSMCPPLTVHYAALLHGIFLSCG